MCVCRRFDVVRGVATEVWPQLVQPETLDEEILYFREISWRRGAFMRRGRRDRGETREVSYMWRVPCPSGHFGGRFTLHFAANFLTRGGATPLLQT